MFKDRDSKIPEPQAICEKDLTIVHENVVLVFNEEDARLVRKWSKVQHSYDKSAEAYNLRGLREDHAHLIRIAERLSKAIAQSAPPPSADLFPLRQELIFTAIRHLKAEDWVLYPRLLVSTDLRVARTARVFSNEMGSLAKEFTTYAQFWGTSAIERDWAGYCRETTRILGDLTQRITREHTDLYPLLQALDEVA